MVVMMRDSRRMSCRFVVSMVLCMIALACTHRPTAEDLEAVAALKIELEHLRAEIRDAEEKNASLAGGLVKALVETRLEILETTEALIRQRIHALESGATIRVEVSASAIDEDRAARLAHEIEEQLVELGRARAEADRYGGGLMGVLKETTVATKEQTIAMLRSAYLAAKYGLPSLPVPAPTGVDPTRTPTPVDVAVTQGLPTVVPPVLSSVASDLATPTAVPPPGSPRPTPTEVAPDLAEKIVSVRLLKKRFSEQDYQEFIWFDIEFGATGLDKPARAVKGVLILEDLFGDAKMRINWTIERSMSPGRYIVERGTGFRYNKFKDEHRWVRFQQLQDIHPKFVVSSILYEDGSRRDF